METQTPSPVAVPVVIENPETIKYARRILRLIWILLFLVCCALTVNITSFTITYGNQSQIYRKALKIKSMSADETQFFCIADDQKGASAPTESPPLK